jgi:hypothetical protein
MAGFGNHSEDGVRFWLRYPKAKLFGNLSLELIPFVHLVGIPIQELYPSRYRNSCQNDAPDLLRWK